MKRRARDRGRPAADDLPHDRVVHQHTCEERDVARARVMPGRVEPVGAHVVRVPQPEATGTRVHHRDEPGLAAVAHVVGQRVGCVICALDQRRLEQLEQREPLPGPQVRRRLADRGGVACDGDDVVQPRVFEREQDRHQLRDAGDRHALSRVVHDQHLAGRSVLDQPRTPGHLGRSGEDWCNEDESRGGDKKPTLHRSASLPRVT